MDSRKPDDEKTYLGGPQPEPANNTPPAKGGPSAVLGFFERARLRQMGRMNLYPQGVWGGMGADTE